MTNNNNSTTEALKMLDKVITLTTLNELRKARDNMQKNIYTNELTRS